MTFLQARTANEVLKARLRRMEVQQKEGELVDRARAVALVFQLARQERDVWLGWPARVAALMAAELGVDAHALQTVLESHVREHLAKPRRDSLRPEVTPLMPARCGLQGAVELLGACIQSELLQPT